MSLLLQALKKAEEDKRRRAALLVESDLESGAELLAVEFPTLNLIEEDVSGVSTENAESIAVVAAEEWHLTTPEVAVSAAAVQADAVVEVTAGIAPLAIGIEPQIETEIAAANEPVAALPEAPPPATTTPAQPDLAVAQVAAPTVAPSSEPAQQRLAKSLFAKRQRPAGSGLLPWLALGAGLLLAGMLAWFTWQYRQLTQPIPSVVANPVASAPVAQSSDVGYVAEPAIIEVPQVDTPASDVVPPTVTPNTSTVKPLESLSSNAGKSVPRVANEGGEHNPPLKFIRQSPNLSAPEPVLLAWQAYQNSDFAQAERIYRKVLLSDPRQRDALLGLAAIAQQRGDTVEAEALYRRLLRFNPQDDSAKAALLALNSAQMPEKDAVQLEQSGQSDPLVLGHYFAAQQRWSQAQEQFFLAYNANPNSADAALNLAVSLDHLKQTALAQTYYRKALQAKEQINFDRNKVEQRLLELDAATGQKP